MHKYYVDADVSKQDATARDVFVYIGEERGQHHIYTPIGQHCTADLGYIKACTPISRADYMRLSAGFYTPADYLMEGDADLCVDV